MATKEFEIQLAKGNTTEILIEGLLQKAGWYTIPIYRHKYDPASAKEIAPKLYGLNIGIVLPDILSFRNGKQVWIECKYEEGASWTYTKQKFEHGFSERLYNSYLDIEKYTNIPVWVIFHEINQESRTAKDYALCLANNRSLPPSKNSYPQNTLIGQKLSVLKIRKSPQGSNQKYMPYIYFDQANFISFGTTQQPDFRALE